MTKSKLATAQTAPEYLANFVSWYYKEHGYTPKTVVALAQYLREREENYEKNVELL